MTPGEEKWPYVPLFQRSYHEKVFQCFSCAEICQLNLLTYFCKGLMMCLHMPIGLIARSAWNFLPPHRKDYLCMFEL